MNTPLFILAFFRNWLPKLPHAEIRNQRGKEDEQKYRHFADSKYLCIVYFRNYS